MKIEVYSSEVKTYNKNYLSVWIYKDFNNPAGQSHRNYYYRYNIDSKQITSVQTARSYQSLRDRMRASPIIAPTKLNDLPAKILEKWLEADPSHSEFINPYILATNFNYSGYKVT